MDASYPRREPDITGSPDASAEAWCRRRVGDKTAKTEADTMNDNAKHNDH
jgi:hypothetical protein